MIDWCWWNIVTCNISLHARPLNLLGDTIAAGYVSNIYLKCVYVGFFFQKPSHYRKVLKINFGHVGRKIFQLMAAIIITVKTISLFQFSPARKCVLLGLFNNDLWSMGLSFGKSLILEFLHFTHVFRLKDNVQLETSVC